MSTRAAGGSVRRARYLFRRIILATAAFIMAGSGETVTYSEYEAHQPPRASLAR
jgi:hypothetical protein